jgi:uridine phosphorylase
MKKLYHLDLEKKVLQGAKIAFLPGDPFRARTIAEAIAKGHGRGGGGGRGGVKKLAWKREFCSYLVRAGKRYVLITSTGIGGPSTSIAIDELARLGVRTFIRVGTTGAIQKNIRTGDVIITTGSVRLDGASTHYAPIEYPAVAHHEVVNALVKGAEAVKLRYHVGVTASSDTFYPGEERTDSFRKYTIKRFQGATREWLAGATREWLALGVLNYEMESSTVLTLTSSMGLKGGSITGVVNRAGGATITKAALRAGEGNVIKASVSALNYL